MCSLFLWKASSLRIELHIPLLLSLTYSSIASFISVDLLGSWAPVMETVAGFDPGFSGFCMGDSAKGLGGINRLHTYSTSL